jgi:predicted ATPase
MATKRTTTPPPAAAPARPPYMLIEQIQVKGYKSLVDATLHVRPLTLLAGTNSSGKSSIMQPLLLIKQTMEAPYQPAGALVLDGAHVQAETAEELVSRISIDNEEPTMQFAISGRDVLGSIQKSTVNRELDADKKTIANQKISTGEVLAVAVIVALAYTYSISNHNFELKNSTLDKYKLGPVKDVIKKAPVTASNVFQNNVIIGDVVDASGFRNSRTLLVSLARLMHIPGLRGAPQRSYPATSFQTQIKGTFDLYAAGTVSQWQQQNNTKALTQLNDSLQRLGLTNAVTAKVKNANEVELSVNRLPAASKAKPRKADMVNIADVGIGVSQVLPILVALIAAQEGQLVYVEQPELHLHPRAQVEMAHLLAAAAKRGVRVIVETHSSLLLLTVQTLVAEGELTPDQVGLHWFARDAKGATTVTLAEVDEDGAYGEWPEDFGDIELTAQRNYLDAVTRRQPKRSAKA